MGVHVMFSKPFNVEALRSAVDRIEVGNLVAFLNPIRSCFDPHELFFDPYVAEKNRDGKPSSDRVSPSSFKLPVTDDGSSTTRRQLTLRTPP